jgi:hypothetical protein
MLLLTSFETPVTLLTGSLRIEFNEQDSVAHSNFFSSSSEKARFFESFEIEGSFSISLDTLVVASFCTGTCFSLFGNSPSNSLSPLSSEPVVSRQTFTF